MAANETTTWIDAEWTCDWQVDGGWFEDMHIVESCGARVRTLGSSAWACEAGHGHRGVEVEWAVDGEVAFAESIVGRELEDHEAAPIRVAALTVVGGFEEDPF